MNKTAEQLLNIKAIHLSPNDLFTWTSGIKSPIYCDNRIIMSYPTAREIIENELANLIKEQYPEATIILGTATAGIPHGCYVSSILNLPAGYVRTEPKKHGMGSQIEGVITKDDKVVLVEDLISTGKSINAAIKPILETGATLLGVASIFTYNLQKANTKFEESGIKLASLTTIEDLIEAAIELDYINEDDKDIIVNFKNSIDN